ncbi:MAG: MFS transporter, partial [Klebsiella sp.]|nr:MFS transporter [Klebsiella sp.]
MTPMLRQNLTLCVLVLIGINMRPLLTSIGPLLPDIRAASGMSYTLVALLTALPVIAMGVLALAGGWVDRTVGQNRSIALSLLIIAAGALLRESAPHSGLLLSSALAGGIGIGIIQAAIPAVIKRLFARRTPLVMGLWSAALMGGGGLGAAFTPW